MTGQQTPEPRDVAAEDQAAARFRDRHAPLSPGAADSMTVSGPELQTMLDFIRCGDEAGLSAWTDARCEEDAAMRRSLAELDEPWD